MNGEVRKMNSEIMPAVDKKAAAPKVILKQTARALKKGKKPPIFTDGELLAWKGVWFRLVGRGQQANGKLVFLLEPQVEEVKDEQPNLASHSVQYAKNESREKLSDSSRLPRKPKEAWYDKISSPSTSGEPAKD